MIFIAVGGFVQTELALAQGTEFRVGNTAECFLCVDQAEGTSAVQTQRAGLCLTDDIATSSGCIKHQCCTMEEL